MEKSKDYRAKFSQRVIRRAIDASRSISKKTAEYMCIYSASTSEEQWRFDDLDEFMSAYGNESTSYANLHIVWDETNVKLSITLFPLRTNVEVRAPTRSKIEKVFSIFEEANVDEKISLVPPAQPPEPKQRPTIFIGHGRNTQWEKLKAHLQDKHGVDTIAYETGARAGHTIRDILDDMASGSSLALLILTGEDKTESGMRARQNVIHECGLFQGRLGFDRAIMIVEEGIELASNFDGIQQLRFKRGRISEVFGDVLATLKREFGPV